MKLIKKTLLGALIGTLIGLLIIPTILIEIYYFGGEDAYLLEVISFVNLQKIIITTIIYNFALGALLTLPILIKQTKIIKNHELKNVFQLFLSIIIVGIMLYILPYLKLSEIINILMTFNILILVILLMNSSFIYNSIQIRKINQKLKH